MGDIVELYKKYRPKKLNRIIGQKATVKTLQNLLENKKIPHALLIHGNSGCGKTTIGRILKTELNCSDNDFYEINCADFRGIETVRDISKKMGYSPVGGDCRIWLVDEIHQMVNIAQHSFLKILEDTPKHIYFILCTTEPDKLLKTIRNRCTEIPVKLLEEDDLNRLLKSVLKREGKEIEDEVREQIIRDSLGSARMLLVLLDKIIDLPKEDQLEAAALKVSEENEAIELCRALIKKESWSNVAKILKGLKGEPESIRYSVLGYARSIMLSTTKGKAASAYLVASAFSENFYDSKMAGLTLACYEALESE